MKVFTATSIFRRAVGCPAFVIEIEQNEYDQTPYNGF